MPVAARYRPSSRNGPIHLFADQDKASQDKALADPLPQGAQGSLLGLGEGADGGGGDPLGAGSGGGQLAGVAPAERSS